MEPFEVTILASDHPFYRGTCCSLTIPTPGGMYGIQAHHSNTVAGIVPGTLSYGLRKARCSMPPSPAVSPRWKMERC